MSDLLPCPFCGCKADIIDENLSFPWIAFCRYCHVITPSCKTYEEAEAIWNKRTSHWINVKDVLPEDGQKILIYCGNHPAPRWIYQAYKKTRQDKSYLYFTENRALMSFEVTHWMYLPIPPVEEIINE